MEAGKVIGNVIIFGGIGAMAYLLLKKKPVVEQTSTTKTFIGGIEESKRNKLYAKLCADSIAEGNSSGKDYVKGCLSIQEKNELTEPLLDQSALQPEKDDVQANTCFELDLSIKSLNKRLISLYELGGLGLPDYLGTTTGTERAKALAEAKFNKFSCRDKIEAVRTRTLVDLQSKGSIKAEETIVNKGFTEQKGYIILGALVLLTGFYAIVKK
jgi:hypothetical protein